MGFVTVAEAKESELIPKPWHEIIPDTCPYCQHPMIISESLTKIRCEDPRCSRRIAGQIVSMLSDLGLKGWGIAKTLDYVQSMKMSSMLQFLLDPPFQFRDIQKWIQDEDYTYPQLIQLMHIPRLQERALDIFKGINSYEEYRQIVDQMGMRMFIASRVGGSALPAQLEKILEAYDPEFEALSAMFKPVPQVQSEMLIAITGSVLNVTADGSKLTKDQYVRLLNDILRPTGMVVRRSDALASVSVIVADTESNTAKYRKGLERGNLVTSDMLYRACLARVDKLKEETNARLADQE